MNPQVSVILPTYNRSISTMMVIRSVQRQTFQDWELIVVDDCSDDGTFEAVGKLIVWELDPKIRLFRTAQLSGSPVVPRNLGVEKARGEWLAFLDSDDLWDDRKLDTMLRYTHLWGGSLPLALFYHNMRVEGREGIEIWDQLSECHSGKVFDKLLVKNFIPTSSVMLPRTLWRPMDPGLTISHDWDLWLELAKDWDVLYIPHVLGTLSMHEGSVITETRRRRAESREVVRRHSPSCKSRRVRWKARAYYRFVGWYDILPVWAKGMVRRLAGWTC